MRSRLALPLVLAVTFASSITSAQPLVPQSIMVQGRLSRLVSGTPQPITGTVTMSFSLYDAPFSGALLAIDGPKLVQVSDGIYEANAAFPSSAFSGTERYVEVGVDGQAMSPRLKLESVPFAYVAQRVGDRLPGDFVLKSGDTMSGPLTVAGLVTSSTGGFRFPDGTVQATATDAASITLDRAYDAGSAGAGRVVDADAGAVQILGPDGLQVSGPVGLGTTSPSAPLHVARNDVSDVEIARFQNENPDGGARIVIERGNGVRAADIEFANAGTATWYAGVLRYGGSPTGRFAISTSPDLVAGGGELVLVNGGVGVNTPAGPEHTLDVGGAGSTGTSRLGRMMILGSEPGYEWWTGAFSGLDGRWQVTRRRISDGLAMTPLTISTVGHIGIGTTTPSHPLSVAGVVESSAGGFRFPDGTTQTTAAGGPPSGLAGGDLVGTYPNPELATSATSLSKVSGGVLTSTGGNIGVNKIDPQYQFDVVGNMRVANGALLTDWPSNEGGRLEVSNSLKTGSQIGKYSFMNMTGPYGNGLQVWAYPADNTTGSSRLALRDDGVTVLAGRDSDSVAIGTNSPESKLHVQGSGYVGFELKTTGGGWPYVDFGSANTDFDIRLTQTATRSLSIQSPDGSTPRLGIGIAAPAHALHVGGKIEVDNLDPVNNTNTLCAEVGGLIGRCSSTRARKSNIVDLTLPGVETTRRLRPVEFDWRGSGEHDLGFIAEEVAAVDPVLAGYDADGRIASVRYSQLTAVLVKAIHEQQAEIEQLKRQIQDLASILRIRE